jgi:hypothetical protein
MQSGDLKQDFDISWTDFANLGFSFTPHWSFSYDVDVQCHSEACPQGRTKVVFKRDQAFDPAYKTEAAPEEQTPPECRLADSKTLTCSWSDEKAHRLKLPAGWYDVVLAVERCREVPIGRYPIGIEHRDTSIRFGVSACRE